MTLPLSELTAQLARALDLDDAELKIKTLKELHDMLESEEMTTLTEPGAVDAAGAELLRALKNSNSNVSTTALSCLAPLYTVLLQEADGGRRDFSKFLLDSPLLPFDRLADARERSRELATSTLVHATRLACVLDPQQTAAYSVYIREQVIEHGFQSKNARAREQALKYLLSIRTSVDGRALPPLKPFSAYLAPLLADADAATRALATSTVVTLYTAPAVTPAAFADLKREMGKCGVSQKVQDVVVEGVLGSHGTGTIANGTESSINDVGATAPPRDATSTAGSPDRTATLGSTAPPATPRTSSVRDYAAPLPESPPAVPVYIAEASELTSFFADLRSHMAGKETEGNWKDRERHVGKLRGMLAGNVLSTQRALFAAEIARPEVYEGLIRAASSLRTTLTIATLRLITALVTEAELALDATAGDAFFAHALSLASQSKRIVATVSQACVTRMIADAAFNARRFGMLCAAMGNERVAGARVFYCEHFATYVRVHGGALGMGTGEFRAEDPTGSGTRSGGLLETATAFLVLALADANVDAKRIARGVLLDEFAPRWPGVYAEVLRRLDGPTRKQLDRYIAGGGTPAATPARGGRTPARATVGRTPGVRATPALGRTPARGAATPSTRPPPSSARSNVRDFILQAKREKARREAEEASEGTKNEAVNGAGTAGDSSLGTEPFDTKSPTAHRSSPGNAMLADSPTRVRARPSLLGLGGGGASANGVPEGGTADVPRTFGTASNIPSAPSSTTGTPPRKLHASEYPSHLTPPRDSQSEALKRQADAAEDAAQQFLISVRRAAGDDTPRGASVADFALSPAPADGRLTDVTARELISPDLNDELETPSAEERQLEEIAALTSRLSDLSIDVQGLARLVQLSYALRCEDVSKGSPIGGATHIYTRWKDAYTAFVSYLDSSTLREDPARAIATLVLFNALLMNQPGVLAGDEYRIVAHILRIRYASPPDPVAKHASETLLSSLAGSIEPLYGLTIVISAFQGYLSQQGRVAATKGDDDGDAYAWLESVLASDVDELTDAMAMLLTCMRLLVLRLPAEILQEEFLKFAGCLARALKATRREVRRGAVFLLVAAQTRVKNRDFFLSELNDADRTALEMFSYYCETGLGSLTTLPLKPNVLDPYL